jgi:uncharacterized alkaline shock family protein YloU
MNDDLNIIDLIERDIMSFDSVSRFPDFGIADNIQRAIGRGIQHPSIKISEDDDGMTINCDIIVYFGVNIPQLCYDIQSKVKNNIEETAGIQIKAINIEIEGVDPKVNDK